MQCTVERQTNSCPGKTEPPKSTIEKENNPTSRNLKSVRSTHRNRSYIGTPSFWQSDKMYCSCLNIIGKILFIFSTH